MSKRNPTPIWIYDRNEKLKLILTPNTQSRMPDGRQQYTQHAGMYLGVNEPQLKDSITRQAIPYSDGWYTEQLNGKVGLAFDSPAASPNAALIEPDGRAVIRDADGHLVEFIIRQPEDHFGETSTKSVFAEGADYELIDSILTGYKEPSVTLETALRAVLQGTRWEVGQIDDFGTNSVDLEDVTVKNAVYQLIEQFGGERRYRVEAVGNTITRRYIDVLKRRGFNNGQRVEDGKNLISMSRLPDTTGIKTAMKGLGASTVNDGARIDFGDVVWSKANGDPVDKPKGEVFVYDKEARQKWGYDQGKIHRFGLYDGQEKDPATLLLNTWNKLQQVNKPVYTYDFKILYQDQRLGDTVQMVNRKIFPHLEGEASVIEFRQNLNDYTQSEVTMGQFRQQFDLASRYLDTEDDWHRNRGNLIEKETPEGAQSKADAALAAAQEEINAAEERISQAEQSLSAAQQDLDLITKEEADGTLALYGKVITNELVSENATIVGTFVGTNAVLKNLTVEDAVITGTLSGVDGTFTGELVAAKGSFAGSIETDENAYVGQNLFLGYGLPTGITNEVNFDYNDYIRAGGGSTFHIRSDLNMMLETQNEDILLFANPAGGVIPAVVQTDTYLVTSAVETGYCAAAGADPDGSGVAAGEGVNFRIKKNYIPSSVVFDPIQYNRTPEYVDITEDGFYMYLQASGSVNLVYWRGRYTC